MRVLGFIGGLDYPYERFFSPYDSREFVHDSAAVLLEDGRVVSAIEEERLNRIKHTDKAPLSAIEFVLKNRGVGLEEVDLIAVYGLEEGLNFFLRDFYLKHPEAKGLLDIKAVIREKLSFRFGSEIDEEKLVFVEHHLAHGVSTFYMSGFNDSLVLTVDGKGDGLSGMVLKGDGDGLEVIDTFSEQHSLGAYYVNVINYLGYDMFDEYKVMALAPYGEPSIYREIFNRFYTMLPQGRYEINSQFFSVLHLLTLPRRRGEPFTQAHKNIAAALQESLEKIVMHILRHHRQQTGLTHLCLAGGVAHNSSMNGKIVYSGLFEKVFVQPAAHDAGCALGAALHAYRTHCGGGPPPVRCPLKHVYWGTHIGEGEELRKKLERWGRFVQIRKEHNITGKAAELMAGGAIIGWAQGRSEFGPRALGNRSILADPRPEKNKVLINDMIKKRESYRPFAPAVLAEYAEDYFELPVSMADFPFMTIVLKVKKEKRNILGAVTHVDGSARVQTVSRDTNPRFWELIEAFRTVTGVPVLLNTSFNNQVEPIVDNVDDVVTCFLTTDLEYLVVGDYFMTKKSIDYRDYLGMVLAMGMHNELYQTKKYISFNENSVIHEIGSHVGGRWKTAISPQVFALIRESDGEKTLKELLQNIHIKTEKQKGVLVTELLTLWRLRLIRLISPENGCRKEARVC